MQCLETAYETEGISPPPGTDLYKIYMDASPQKKVNFTDFVSIFSLTVINGF